VPASAAPPEPAELVPAPAGSGSTDAELTALALNGVTSEHSKRAYAKGLAQFSAWVKERPPQVFVKAMVQQYRDWLLEQNSAPATVNIRLSPLRKLGREMADKGLFDPSLATGIEDTSGIKQRGIRAGNWLAREQASDLLSAPDPATLKGKRDRAMLPLLVGCGQRRGEPLALNVEDIQQRESRWVIPDLKGKGNRLRFVPVPAPVKARIDAWLSAAAITKGRIFQTVNKGGRVVGHTNEDEKAVWQVVVKYARATSLGALSPHDLRRCCAKLCRKAGGDSNRFCCCSATHPSRPRRAIWGRHRTLPWP